jgi:hypothetical protein
VIQIYEKTQVINIEQKKTKAHQEYHKTGDEKTNPRFALVFEM